MNIQSLNEGYELRVQDFERWFFGSPKRSIANDGSDIARLESSSFLKI